VDSYSSILLSLPRKDEILKLWEELLALVATRRARLEKVMRLQKVFQEMINGVDWMDDIKVHFMLVRSSIGFLTSLSSFMKHDF
jgi:hypothetical protein